MLFIFVSPCLFIMKLLKLGRRHKKKASGGSFERGKSGGYYGDGEGTEARSQKPGRLESFEQELLLLLQAGFLLPQESLGSALKAKD